MVLFHEGGEITTGQAAQMKLASLEKASFNETAFTTIHDLLSFTSKDKQIEKFLLFYRSLSPIAHDKQYWHYRRAKS